MLFNKGMYDHFLLTFLKKFDLLGPWDKYNETQRVMTNLKSGNRITAGFGKVPTGISPCPLDLRARDACRGRGPTRRSRGHPLASSTSQKRAPIITVSAVYILDCNKESKMQSRSYLILLLQAAGWPYIYSLSTSRFHTSTGYNHTSLAQTQR